MSERIGFRPLVEADLPMLHGWLNEPGVVRWWEGDDVSWEAVVRDYGPGPAGEEGDASTEHWIAEIDGEPIGWISCYPAADGEEEAQAWLAADAGVEQTAAGIDYLIAAPERRGQGLGRAMIRAFVFNVVFGRHCEWTQAVASPYAANVASCRALAKAGFDHVATIDGGDDPDGPCQLMVFPRPPRARES